VAGTEFKKAILWILYFILLDYFKNHNVLEMGVISVFRWTGCEEILLGFLKQLLDKMRAAVPRNPTEREYLHILFATRQTESSSTVCSPVA
jgi:hypothetical protein